MTTKADHFRVVSTTALALMVALLFGLLIMTATTKPAHAKANTFTVNSTDDDPAAGPTDDGECTTAAAGECTLRAAIQEANASKGKDTINFGISGAGPHTITVGSLLPEITKPVTINGYSQPGASENTLTQPGKTDAVLKIRLDGDEPGNSGDKTGLTITGSKVVVKGLAITAFGTYGIHTSGSSNTIEGNFIGTLPDGTSRWGNSWGVALEGADGSTIGGTSAAARNLISGNIFTGVTVFDGSSGNTIQGNLIGLDKNGGPLGNSVLDGVEISWGTGNRILSNSIFSNGGLGINLNGGTEDAKDVTANDPDDPNTSKPDPDKDTGPNNLQNYPDITSAQVFKEIFGDTTTITGELTSTPKNVFTIQFFSSPSEDPSHFGEGQTFLGEILVKTDANGVARDANGNTEFTLTVGEDLTNQYVTTTATSKKGDTSEFSEAERVEPPVIGGP